MLKKYFFILLLFLYPLAGHSQSTDRAEIFMEKGITAYQTGNYANALEFFKKSLKTADANDNFDLQGKLHNNLANTYSQMGKSELALQHYLLSVAAAKKNKDSLSVAKTYKNIGALYEEQKDFKRAMSYYEDAENRAIQLKSKTLQADCLNNKGVVYEQQLQYSKALACYLEALPIYQSEKDQQRISMTLNNLAIVYKYLKNYPKSIRYYEAALALSEQLGDQFMVSANQNNLGNVYALTGNYKKALELCQLAHANAKKINAQEVVVESLDGIAVAYERMGKWSEAVFYRKEFEREKDNYINTERSSQLADMQVRYETTKKEAEITQLQQQNKIKNLEITKKQLVIERRNQLIVFFILLFAGAAITAYFWRSRQKVKHQLAKEQTIWETEEQERIRIAKDIHDDLGSGLSKINFLSEIILQKTADLPEIRSNSEAVKETAVKMIGNMRDLIWALNPDNTTLANLIARMREYTTDYLDDFPIEVRFDFPDYLPQTPITKESHRELFMVVKETLNNIAKHAQATEVQFQSMLADDSLLLLIKDNGIGFENEDGKGNGLRNMKARLLMVGGQLAISSKMGSGTTIKVIVPLKQMFKRHH